MSKYGREIWAVAQRILVELLRRRRSLVFWSIFPITILLLNGLILAERAQLTRPVAFAQATPMTLVGAALFFSCLGGSVATVVSEREQRTLKRLFLSPLSGLSYFLGIVVAHWVIGIGQTLLVLVLSLSLGAEFTGSWLWTTCVIFLSILGYVGVGFILGTQLARRAEDVNAIVAAFGVPLLILGGAFLPAQLFPESLLRLARLNPIYHMQEALSGVMLNVDNWETIAPHLWFLVGFTALMVAAGWLSYRQMLWAERRL